MVLAETLPELLTDRSHMLFEAVTGLGEAVIGFVAAKVWVKLHDRKHHSDCNHGGDND